MVAMERRLAVGAQEGPELVDKHSEDTLDKEEQPEPKELIEITKLLNPDEIKVKRESPVLVNLKRIDGENSRLVYGAGVSWS